MKQKRKRSIYFFMKVFMLVFHLFHSSSPSWLLWKTTLVCQWFAVPALCLSPKHTNNCWINCLCLDMFCFPEV